MTTLPAAPAQTYRPLTAPTAPLALDAARAQTDAAAGAPVGAVTAAAVEHFRTGPLQTFQTRAAEVEAAVLDRVAATHPAQDRDALVAPVRNAVFAGFALSVLESSSGVQQQGLVHPTVANELAAHGHDLAAGPVARRAAAVAAQTAYLAARDPQAPAAHIVAGADLTGDVPAVPAPQPGLAAAPAPAPRRRSKLVRGLVGVVVALVASFGIAAFQAHQASASAPKVGQCVKQKGEDGIEKVDCADPSASYTVVKHVDDTTDGDTACADTQASTYYVSEVTDRGASVGSFVLCLEDR